MRSVIKFLGAVAVLLWAAAILFPLTDYPVGLGGVFVMSFATLLVSIESYRNLERVPAVSAQFNKMSAKIAYRVSHVLLGLFSVGAVVFTLFEIVAG
jgi:hypothetical protein